MMYSPMPDKYVGAGLSDLSILPEEEEGSNQMVVSDQSTVRPFRTQLHCVQEFIMQRGDASAQHCMRDSFLIDLSCEEDLRRCDLEKYPG